MSGSGISWAICKSAHRSRQITLPAPHYSVFFQAGCPSCRPTNSVKALKAVVWKNTVHISLCNYCCCWHWKYRVRWNGRQDKQTVVFCFAAVSFSVVVTLQLSSRSCRSWTEEELFKFWKIGLVLWRCWLGGRKGIRPVKNWVVGCWRGCLSGARCRLEYGSADATATHRLLLQ